MVAHPHGKVSRILFSVLTGIGGVVSINAVYGFSRSVSYHILWILACAALSAGAYLFGTLNERRIQTYFGIFSLVFVLLQAVGYTLQINQRTTVGGWLLCLSIGVCCAPAAAYCFILLMRLLAKAKPAGGSHPRAVFRLSLAAILLGWLPVFLAYYPGLFTYDVGVQIPQVLTGAFSARHPLLHTLWIGGFYQLGSLLGNVNLGVAAATVLQMIVMAVIFAWFIRYLYLQGSPKYLWIGSLVIFALLPVHSLLSISMTKDVLFAGFMLLLTIRLHQLSQNPVLLRDIRWVIATVALGVAACLLRNNTVFCLILFLPVCVFLFSRPYRLRCLALLCGIVLLYFGVNTGLKAILNAHDQYIREYVSIPSQQLARVYTLHKDDDPDSIVIKWNVPGADEYVPSLADNTKSTAQVLSHDSLVSFLKLWGLVGLRYPLDYIDAFLLNTQGYWWLDDATHAAAYSEAPESRQGYLSTDTVSGLGVTHRSLFPGLESLYERLFSANEYQRVPLLSFLLAPGVYVWFILFSLVRGLYLHRRDYIMISGLMISYLLTLLLGPGVLVRYAYPFFVCVPFLWLPRGPACGGPLPGPLPGQSG